MDFDKILDYTSSALDYYNMGNAIGGIINPNAPNKANNMDEFALSLHNRLKAKNEKGLSDGEGAVADPSKKKKKKPKTPIAYDGFDFT